MECIMVSLVIFIVGIAWVIENTQNVKGKTKSGSIHSSNRNPSRFDLNERDENSLPNGYTHKDYYDYGYSDFDIEYWGLDQPGAPSPPAAGFVISDMMDDDDLTF